MKNAIFITGTGTDVGKTHFTALLTRTLRASGTPALALKPISCGGRDDATLFAQANEETLSLNDINPLLLAPPLAPYAACVIEDKPLDWEPVHQTLQRLADLHPGPFLIEGVGGWKVPLTRTMTVADWAVELDLPVLVVANAGLGTLNHTLLTIESIHAHGCRPLGIILNLYQCDPNDIAVRTNPAILEDITGLPVLTIGEDQDTISIPPWLAIAAH